MLFHSNNEKMKINAIRTQKQKQVMFVCLDSKISFILEKECNNKTAISEIRVERYGELSGRKEKHVTEFEV